MAGLKTGLGALAVALMTSVGVANACEGSTVLFEDDFSSLQPTWGTTNDEVSVSSNQMLIKPEAGFAKWVPSNAGFYDDIDACADFTTVAAVDADHSYAGIVFWYTDDSNFYAFEYAGNGNASVWRRQRGKWLNQVSWQPAGPLKGGDGATNQLRVVTKGNQATFYINGQQFAQLRGTPPTDGQQIGLLASSPDNASSTYGVANLKVTQPQ